MAIVTMAFTVRLGNIPGGAPWTPNGPLFHRFVPNGEGDAILLTQESDPHNVRVWFNRNAELDGGGLLKWARDGRNFDPNIMRRQAKLDGGPLYGDLSMPDVSDEEMAALLRDPRPLGAQFGQGVADDPNYVALAKRVIRVLHPCVANLLATLRYQYGQYWLPIPPSFDSRKQTLGSYCTSTYHLRWFNEEARSWCWVLPTDTGATINMGPLPGRGYEEYLTEQDWRRLQHTRCLSDVSVEVQLIGSAGRALDSGEYRQAFIEVASALELTIARRLVSRSETVRSAVQSFLDGETQRAQIAVLFLSTGLSEGDIETALKAVEVRNRVAHEGYMPNEQDATGLRDVIKSIQKLSGLVEIKVPVLTSSNALFAA